MYKFTPRELTNIALGACQYAPEDDITIPYNVAVALGAINVKELRAAQHKDGAVIITSAGELAGTALALLYKTGEIPSKS